MYQKDNWRETTLSKEWMANFNQIAGGLFLILVGVGIGLLIFEGTDGGLGYFTNVYTEIIGVAVTVVIIEKLFDIRRTNELKEQLRWETRSLSRDIALNAVDTLRHKGWLTTENGVLRNAVLAGANLRQVNFAYANLHKVDLMAADLHQAIFAYANLRYANLNHVELQQGNLTYANLKYTSLRLADLEGALISNANLQQADLSGINLQHAELWGSNLQSATLREAELQHAVLEGVNLHGADLREANLYGADLTNVKFNDTTILPDGTHWSPETDMSQFTQNPTPPSAPLE